MPSTIEKGAFFLFIANLIFFASSYLIYFFLGRILGPAEFGIYGVVISLATLITMMYVTGVEQSVSRFVSETPSLSEKIKGAASRIQLVISLSTFAAYLLLAPYIAQLLNDPGLTPLLQLSSVLFLFHPFISVFSGDLNGLKRFVRQSRLLGSYSIAKMLLIIGLVFFGFGVAGAISGFIFASIFGFALGFALTGFSFGSRGFPYSKLLNFMVPVVCFAVVTNVLLNFDLLAVKALSPQMVSDSLAGFYTAAGTISKIPYGLVGSLIIVLFPLVSGTFNANRKEKSSFYLSSAMRYSMLILLPLTIMISVSPAEIISFIYGDEFANGAAPLSILSFALFFLALFVVLSTAISASDKPKVSLAIGLAAVAIDVALNIALVPLFSMNGAAFSTLIASLFAFLVAFAYAELRFRSVLGIPAFVKILFASLIIGAMSHFFPSSGLLLVLKYCLLLVFYIAALFALKGISKTDWAILHNVIR